MRTTNLHVHNRELLHVRLQSKFYTACKSTAAKQRKIKMQVNIIEAYRTIVAIADTDLIGKQFFEEKKQLDVKESFYKGEQKSSEEVKEIIQSFLQEDATFNIVGEKSVNTAKEIGLITEESIGTIDEIPYAMFLL